MSYIVIPKDSLKEIVLAIDKTLLTKKRLLTEDFLKEIIVLGFIYSKEKFIKEGLEKGYEKEIGEDIEYAIETLGFVITINFTPEAIPDLLVNLKKNRNSEFINVTPEWINKVLILYEDVYKNYQLCLIADKFSK